MILSNITTPLLGLVDTAVMGHLAYAYYLGGTTVGAMLVTSIVWLCGFLRMSTTGLTAQAVGGEQSQQNLLILCRGLVVALTIGLIFIIGQSFYIQLGLSLAGGSAQVQFYAQQYVGIRIWSLPAGLANLVILGWLLGNQHAKSVMGLLIATNLINLVLDLLLVVVFNGQVAGVAFASLTAEYFQFFGGLSIIYMAHKKIINQAINELKTFVGSIFNWGELSHYFRLNRDILIRTICLELCFIFITFQGARLGDTVVAANAILLNFLLLISFALDGVANAAEVLVGKAKGQKNHHLLTTIVNISLLWTLIFALFYSLIFGLFGDALIGFMSNINEVVKLAKHYLVWIIILPIVSCWCYLFDGIYIGLMAAKTMRNSMIISTFGLFFPTWFVLQGWGNNGLWAAFSLFMLTRGITLAWHYNRYIKGSNTF